MNVVLPEKPKILNRRNVTYMTILVLCAVAIAIAVYQFFTEEKLDVILGLTKDENEEITELRADFNNLFTNDLQIKQKSINNEITKNKENEESTNNYSLDVKIPEINIDNNIAQKYNQEIKNTFEKTTENVLKTQDRNIVFTVNYMACIQNDILSVAILSTLKQGDGVQRTILQTYNYNIKTNKEASLQEFMKIKYLDKKILQQAIETEVKSSQEQTEQLKELGYNIYARNVTDEMYNLENATNYFMYDGYLYIIYAYGNKNDTSEMDIVII